MDVPPSRYRVVEQGRRLVVIDTSSGIPVSGIAESQRSHVVRLAEQLRESNPDRDAPPPTSTRAPSTPGPIEIGDPRVLTTQGWFDDKAPRRIRIDESRQGGVAMVLIPIVFAAMIAFFVLGWPVLLAGFLLIQPGVRKIIRGAITRWLDGMPQVG